MVDTEILSNNITSSSLDCYTTFRRMTTCSDTLLWSDITPTFDPVTDLDLITEFNFLPNCARFPCITFTMGATCQQGAFTTPNTWFYPILELAFVLILIQISYELILFSDIWILNIPRYFRFAWDCIRGILRCVLISAIYAFILWSRM